MRAALLIGASFLLSGCSQDQPGRQIGSNAYLDCAKGFDTLVTEIEARPGLRRWGSDIGRSRLYQDDLKETLYLVSRPGHAAHPAIIVRQVVASTESASVHTGGCGYGDAEALNRDLRAYEALDAALAAELGCALCGDVELSPWARQVDSSPPPPSHPHR